MSAISRSANKAKFKQYDTPDESDFSTLFDSLFFKVDDAGIGLRDHNPTLAYARSQGVFDPATATVFKAQADVPPNTALADTAFWLPSVTALTVINVVDVDAPTELNALTVGSGVVVFVREGGDVVKGGTIYLHAATQVTQDSPFILDSGDAPTPGSWVAIAGRNMRGAQGGITITQVANLDNPTELNSISASEGILQLVRQTGAFDKGATLYMYDASASTAQSPWALAAATAGRWIAIAGRYVREATRGRRAVTGRIQSNPNQNGTQFVISDDSAYVTITVAGPGEVFLPANPVDGQQIWIRQHSAGNYTLKVAAGSGHDLFRTGFGGSSAAGPGIALIPATFSGNAFNLATFDASINSWDLIQARVD